MEKGNKPKEEVKSKLPQQTELEKAAERLARTGEIRDLKRYLKSRRNAR